MTKTTKELLPKDCLLHTIKELRGEDRKEYDQHGEHLLHHAANIIEDLMEHVKWPIKQ